MLNIVAKTIPHKTHRYETVGDYFRDPKGVQQFRVSDMGNKDYEFLVLLHELVESHLCQKRGIAEEKITEFDKWFEQARDMGMIYDDDEPGTHPNSPYLREHMFAMMIERAMAREIGIDWEQYNKTVMGL
jgi:hypothetical protein